ncbi:serine hydrolase domain-containing protein [Sandaracinobacter sp.]|uniref:serine hydrolase domain-containing protein n=1 Tax=Sandaracinobacter sp. TaxID=2487581 RepID=UPI0035B404BE
MRILTLAVAAIALATPAAAQSTGLEAALPEIRKGFADWQLDNRVPGLVWGIVKDGRLIHVEGVGVQDLEAKRPVTADSAFRIASMSKAFTAYEILHLEAQGKLSLSDPASKHVPELNGWAAGVTVGDLLHHTAGFVTDDPWGDRQQVRTPAEFTAMLKAGFPLQSAPGSAYEYSNFGYATLGRIITNVSGKPYQRQIGDTVLTPLGMGATTYDVFKVPDARLARGYRWENGQWVAEPMMKDGEFGAMGGVVTTAIDYAKWVSHLLSGWPAQAKAGGNGAVIRAMRTGGGIPHGRGRPGKDAPDCRMTFIYAGGLVSGNDCLLGPVLFHSGGYPGYGSHMLLLPEAGVGLFAFANRTYAAPLPPVWDAAGALQRAGLVKRHGTPLSPQLAAAYAVAQRLWEAGRIDAEPGVLAENMLMDRSAESWAAEFQRLKAESGTCDTSAPIIPTGAMSGQFQWRCTVGRINGQLLLAPTPTPQIQALRLSRP